MPRISLDINITEQCVLYSGYQTLLNHTQQLKAELNRKKKKKWAAYIDVVQYVSYHNHITCFWHDL